jgi:threonyl-tRNA synthetase
VSAPIQLTFPDGSSRTFPPGTTARAALVEWAPDRAGTFLAALVDGHPVDLARTIEKDAHVAPLSFDDRAGREILQHSAAHLVAKAVVAVVPEARPTVGPPTDEGFYYDFDVRPFTPEDLDAIRKSMQASVRTHEEFRRREVSRDEAERLFAENPYKRKYIADTPAGETISLYDTGAFVDLCRGPHVPDTGWLEGIHLLGFSAITSDKAEPGHSLQRIRGVGFPTRAALAEYLKLRSEAEGRDHRTLGQKLELFTFFEESPGFPVILPNGIIVIRELERFVREHLAEAGYREVRTPLLFAQSVYETSGHWALYRENMFLTTAEDRVFGWKPMNCPGSMLIFKSRARSYRELPLRLAEFAPLHRLEASGTLHGMTRVREFVQDDAHLFVTEEQIEAEVQTLLAWIARAFSTFRLRWSYELSTRPAEFLGDVAIWDRAEATLERILRASGVEYKISPGEGAFYGPKIDIHVRDSLGRPWQTGTIQLDYQMPIRFGLQYQGPDGQLHTPVVVHRVILGSFERFLGVLLEHTGGRLPPWLAPVQVRILPVTERQTEAAEGLALELRADHLRVEVASTEESLSKRVRTAEVERVPYVVVLGEKEVGEGTVALRVRGTKETRTFGRAELRDHLGTRIRAREFDP